MHVSMTPRLGAAWGLALAVPIGLLLLVVALQIEPLGALLRSILTDDGVQPNALGRVYMLGGLLLLPLALGVAAWPMIRRGADGRRHVHAANLAVVAVVAVLVVLTWGAFAEEVVRCDVLVIPNCD